MSPSFLALPVQSFLFLKKSSNALLFLFLQIFEDTEFNQMEEEARRESEREELSKEIRYGHSKRKFPKANHATFSRSDLTHVMRKHEKQLSGIEDQQRRVLEAVRRETRSLEQQRLNLVRQLEMVR